MNTHPWRDNTALLVLGNNDSVSATMQKHFIKYLRNGGKILSLCSPFTFQVVKHPWDGRFEPFTASVEINHPLRGESQIVSICEPFYFPSGECCTEIYRIVSVVVVCLFVCLCFTLNC